MNSYGVIPENASQEFSFLKEFVVEVTGLSFLDDTANDYSLRRALNIRMRETDAKSVGDYFSRIKRDGDARELKELVDELTIGETHFFRDSGIFESLKKTILPAIQAEARDEEPVRIWSAGCSIGAEPYSLSILMEDRVGGDKRGYRILGTDINRRFLRQAETARFAKWTMRDVGEDVLTRCFRQVGNEWELDARYRKNVAFFEHNLVSDPIPDPRIGLEKLDLIICRNVAIYFRVEALPKLLRQFQESLAPGGWLVLGHAEVLPQTMDSLATFEPVYTPGGIVYRNRPRQATVQPVPAVTSVKITSPVRMEAAKPFKSAPVVRPQPTPQPTPLRTHRAEPDMATSPVDPVTTPRPPNRTPHVASLGDTEHLRGLIDDGRWPDGLAMAEILIEDDPLNDENHRCHGVALSHLGRHSEAEAAFRRSVYLNHDNLLSHYLLASLLKDCGDLDRARREFRALAKKLEIRDPDSPIIAGSSTRAGELYAVLALWLDDEIPEQDVVRSTPS